MPENGNIVEKIKKLLNLALDNSNPAEAEAAMVKARELMLKHAVDEAELHGRQVVSDTEVFVVNLDRSFEGWMKVVQMAIASLYDAQLYISKKRSARSGNLVDVATFVCSATDFPLLTQSYGTAIAVILRASAAVTDGRAIANSYRVGAANGLLDAVRFAKEHALDEASTAIVLVKAEAIAKRGAEMFPITKNKTFRVGASDQEAYQKGYEFGRGMDAGKVTKKLSE